ncbi:FAD-binding oxidoreductase [Streptomyces thinghirensis]
MDRFAQIVGSENVTRKPDLSGTYGDPFSSRPHQGSPVGGAVRPASVEEVQEIVRAAQEAGVPLWTVSRGKNLDHGGSAPRVPGSVVLDLHRMRRIIQVDDELGYAIVEPGVTFFDLYEHIVENDLRLWPSVLALGWGSVLGNTMDRGWGYTPASDHSNQQCGMEVVLPDGGLLRTGMGAIDSSPTWPLFRGGYGPAPDGMFMHSGTTATARYRTSDCVNLPWTSRSASGTPGSVCMENRGW